MSYCTFHSGDDASVAPFTLTNQQIKTLLDTVKSMFFTLERNENIVTIHHYNNGMQTLVFSLQDIGLFPQYQRVIPSNIVSVRLLPVISPKYYTMLGKQLKLVGNKFQLPIDVYQSVENNPHKAALFKVSDDVYTVIMPVRL
jgi:hypothetical protein